MREQSLDLDGECQIRRVIMSEGRSRGYINGSPVPAQSLREFGERLVDIHGQHEHQSLMKRELQRQLLDNHGGHDILLTELANIHRDWKQSTADIEAIVGTGQDRDSRLEFLRFQLQELDALAPLEGEVEQLHEEHKRLSNAGQLLETCDRHIKRLYDDEHSVQSDISHALERVGDIYKLGTNFTALLKGLPDGPSREFLKAVWNTLTKMERETREQPTSSSRKDTGTP